MEQKIFLVSVVMRTSYYSDDYPSREDTTQSIIRLVYAESEVEAKKKMHREYQVDYSDYTNPSENFEFEYDYYSSNSFDEIEVTAPIL